mgnify:CR=1 FL=1
MSTVKIIDEYIHCKTQANAKGKNRKYFFTVYKGYKKGLEMFDEKKAYDSVFFEKPVQEDYVKDLGIIKTKLQLYKNTLKNQEI